MNDFNGDGRHGLQRWRDGVVTDLTDWGSVPSINARGDIAFHRSYHGIYTGQIWMLRDGRFVQMTDDDEFNDVPVINDRGDIVYDAGRPFITDVRLLFRRPERMKPPGSVRPR